MMKVIKKILLTVCIVGTAGVAFSQGIVKGVVVDSNSGEALVGAAVAVENTTIGTLTSLDGSFVLKVPVEKGTIKVTFVGYSDKTIEVTIPSGTEKDLGQIQLTASSIGLEEVLVVSSFVRDRTTPVAV